MSESNVDLMRRYFDAIEAAVSPEELATFFTPDVIQEEFPNRLVPQGARRELKQILEAFKRGKQIVRSQRYEIVHAICEGDEIALEARWSGMLLTPVGPLAAGAPIHARFGIFVRLVGGRIARQRNYDCFEPF